MQVSAKIIDAARFDALLSINSDIPRRMAHGIRQLTAYCVSSSAALTASAGRVAVTLSVSGDTPRAHTSDELDEGVGTTFADSNEAVGRLEEDFCF